MKANKSEALRIFEQINYLLDLLEDLIPDATRIGPKLLNAIALLDR